MQLEKDVKLSYTREPSERRYAWKADTDAQKLQPGKSSRLLRDEAVQERFQAVKALTPRAGSGVFIQMLGRDRSVAEQDLREWLQYRIVIYLSANAQEGQQIALTKRHVAVNHVVAVEMRLRAQPFVAEQL